MLFAVLEFWDILIIFGIVSAFSGGVAAYIRPSDQRRLIRLEKKIDLIMTHLGLEYAPPVETTWQKLAESPSGKIQAIAAYREENACGLAEAKKAVEDYVQGIEKSQ